MEFSQALILLYYSGNTLIKMILYYLPFYGDGVVYMGDNIPGGHHRSPKLIILEEFCVWEKWVSFRFINI